MAACESAVSAVVSDLLIAVTESVDSAPGQKTVCLPYISSHRLPKSIGMTSYWNQAAPGIGGEFKQRYTDFIVHEITKEGKIIRLSGNVKPPLASWVVGQKGDKSNENPEEKEQFVKCFDEKIYTQLNELAEKDKKCSEAVEFTASEDKDLRKQQHHAIKVLWPSLIAETVNTPDGQRLIRVVRQSKQLQGGHRRSDECRWPGDQRYCHFVLYKEQLDTSAVIAYLSRCLHIPVKAFQFAGMKDKRGSTTQRISVDRTAAEKIIGAVNGYPSPCSCIMISDFSYEPEPIRLGDLAGNHFQVVLRQIQRPDMVDSACEALRDFGFANYFGNQRFGTAASFSTADIGLLLLQCRWSDAIDAIVKAALETKCDRGGSDPRVGQVSAAWFEKRDAEEAARLFPGPYRSPERQMLQAISKNPSDFIGALRKLPRNLILMYGHAYQSLLWNRIVARRISEFGNTKVLPGDLIAIEIEAVKCDDVRGAENDDIEELYDAEVDDGKTTVTYVTPENINNVKITDVVLPLPGFDVSLPKNEIADWYNEMLKSDGVKFSECGKQMPELMLSGTYRPLMVKPANFTWRLVSYEHHTDQLNVTDRDKVLSSSRCPSDNDNSEAKGSKSALILDFQLPACSYASVLFWELSKPDCCSSNSISS